MESLDKHQAVWDTALDKVRSPALNIAGAALKEVGFAADLGG